MLYAKAFAIGVVTGVLAPIVIAVVRLVILPLAGFIDVWLMSVASGSSSFDSYSVVTTTLESVFLQMAAGFAIGFLGTLWWAMVKNEGRRPG